jgi:hypothetical protein
MTPLITNLPLQQPRTLWGIVPQGYQPEGQLLVVSTEVSVVGKFMEMFVGRR